MALFRYHPKGGRFGLPFWELEKMRDHMESIYSTLAGGVSQIRKNYTGVFPLVNLSEDEDTLYLTAELPGAAADKLEVSVKGDTISLRGQIGNTEAGEEVNFHRRERESGAFRRTLTLPAKVDVDKVDAAFKNGVLTVAMPKAAEARAHHISVKTD
ncbi:Hsp20/alpha crystallin family protein [Deltaproteobacteria bacterium OttesenSCG-928-K17]|nr:Hsp20/alpha crystallin family protein [Deltaproteobacteria bacterium OttesenSCG-928-K17]